MLGSIQLTPAVRYIRAYGDERLCARLDWVLEGRDPGPPILRALLQSQNADGGFANQELNGAPSAVHQTMTALWWLEELGLLESEAANRVADYLITRQNTDGGWEENPALSTDDLPPWITPGEPATRIYLTAYATYWLGRTYRISEPAFYKGIQFLKKDQSPDGKFSGYLHNTWIATSALILAGPAYSSSAESGLSYLVARPLQEWADSQIAWALDNLTAAGLTVENIFIKKGLDELQQRQNTDGSWASEDGERYAAVATLQVVKVFKRLGQSA